MEQPSISQDDLIDVMEMTEKLEFYMVRVLKGVESSLALSALMNATVNSLVTKCTTLDEVIGYRNILVKVLDASILAIKIKNSD